VFVFLFRKNNYKERRMKYKERKKERKKKKKHTCTNFLFLYHHIRQTYLPTIDLNNLWCMDCDNKLELLLVLNNKPKLFEKKRNEYVCLF